MNSLAYLFALRLPTTQFSQFLLCACNLYGPLIVASRVKSFNRTFPCQRFMLRALIDAKACRTSRINAASPITNNLSRMVATKHSALSERICRLFQSTSLQSPWPTASWPTAIDNRSTMKSRSSARNASAPKRLKLLLLRFSSKQRFHGVLWSSRQTTALYTISTPHTTVLHSIFLYMVLGFS